MTFWCFVLRLCFLALPCSVLLLYPSFRRRVDKFYTFFACAKRKFVVFGCANRKLCMLSCADVIFCTEARCYQTDRWGGSVSLNLPTSSMPAWATWDGFLSRQNLSQSFREVSEFGPWLSEPTQAMPDLSFTFFGRRGLWWPLLRLFHMAALSFPGRHRQGQAVSHGKILGPLDGGRLGNKIFRTQVRDFAGEFRRKKFFRFFRRRILFSSAELTPPKITRWVPNIYLSGPGYPTKQITIRLGHRCLWNAGNVESKRLRNCCLRHP